MLILSKAIANGFTRPAVAARLLPLGRDRHSGARARRRPAAHLAVAAEAAQGAGTIFMSPDGDQALALVGNDVWVVTVPMVGGATPTVTVGDNPNFPARKLDDIGAQFPHWDGRQAGALVDRQRARRSTISRAARAFDDSVRQARRAARGADAWTPRRRRPDVADAAAARGTARTSPQFKPREFRVLVTAQRDMPQSDVGAARRARHHDEGQRGHRERRRRRSGTTASSASASADRCRCRAARTSIDVAGKTIMPGFVDTHAHLRVAAGDPPRRGVVVRGESRVRRDDGARPADRHDRRPDVRGRARRRRSCSGRASTRPARASSAARTSASLDARAHACCKRYSDYYDTKTIKEYVAGNREQRQWIIQAAREQQLMPTTEGWARLSR